MKQKFTVTCRIRTTSGTDDTEAKRQIQKTVALLTPGYGIGYLDPVKVSFAWLPMNADLHFGVVGYGLSAADEVFIQGLAQQKLAELEPAPFKLVAQFRPD